MIQADALVRILQVSPPHENWSGFIERVEASALGTDQVQQAFALASRDIQPDSPLRFQAWLFVRDLRAWTGAECRALHDQLAEAWPSPDPLQRDLLATLQVFVALADLASDLPGPVLTLLRQLAGNASVSSFSPSFPGLVRAQGATKEQFREAIEAPGAAMQCIVRHLGPELAAALACLEGTG